MLTSNPRGVHTQIADAWAASLEPRRRPGLDLRPASRQDRFHDPAGHVLQTALPVLAAAIVDGDSGAALGTAIDDVARIWALDMRRPEDAAEAVEAVRPILGALRASLSVPVADPGRTGGRPGGDDVHNSEATGRRIDSAIDARVTALAARVARAVAACRDELKALPDREAARLAYMKGRRRCHSGRPSAP